MKTASDPSKEEQTTISFIAILPRNTGRRAELETFGQFFQAPIPFHSGRSQRQSNAGICALVEYLITKPDHYF